MGLESGSTMLHRMRKCPAPSIRADSSRLTGMLLEIAVFMISRLNALKACGRMSADHVSSMPRLLISIYSGMIPPVKYKVNIKRNVSVVRPFNCLRDSG
ncbi:hypothetical protein D3C76_1056970 [compost metagenome]